MSLKVEADEIPQLNYAEKFLYRVKTDDETWSEIEHSGPSETATRVLVMCQTGTKELILACRAISFSLVVFSGPALTSFVEPLRRAKLIPKSDGVAPTAKSGKLSMLKKIGECASFFLDDRILPLLAGASGHSTLYQLALLVEEIPGDQEEKIQEFWEILQTLDGDLRRETVIDCRASLQATPEQQAASQASNSIASDQRHSAATHTESADLVLAIMSPASLRPFDQSYADPNQLEKMLVIPRIAENAVFVAFARMRDFPIIETEVLWRYGFSRSSALMLVHPLDKPDLHEAQVAIVAVRGSATIVRPVAASLLKSGGLDTFTAQTIAESFAPTAKVKRQIFASEPTDGWLTTAGEANWEKGEQP